jgi:hypothetical protein
LRVVVGALPGGRLARPSAGDGIERDEGKLK